MGRQPLAENGQSVLTTNCRRRLLDYDGWSRPLHAVMKSDEWPQISSRYPTFKKMCPILAVLCTLGEVILKIFFLIRGFYVQGA